MKKVAISQSNYIPWKGYFDNIAAVDVFVLYDDMQYTKRDWRNRNYINTQNGLKWLTIPVQVKGKYYQKINETNVSDLDWNKKHWNILYQNYLQAPCFEEVSDWLNNLYQNCAYSNLSEINHYFLQNIMNYLGITTKLINSSVFEMEGDKTEKLVSICRQLDAEKYFTGPAAKDYIETDLFTKEGIEVEFFDYSNYPEYPQIHGEFEHGVTILDMLFNLGDQSVKYMKNLNP